MRFDAYLSQAFNDAAGLMAKPVEREDEDLVSTTLSRSHRAKPPVSPTIYKH